MSWPIRFLEHPPLHGVSESKYYNGTIDFARFGVGDMAYYHQDGAPLRDVARLREMNLTAFYFANNAAQRSPLVLALPDYSSPNGKLYFLVDGQCYSSTCTRCGKSCYRGCKCPGEHTPKGHYDAWTVTGTEPLITVAPSVNYDVPAEDGHPAQKRYHGFIKNGVIGDG